MTIPTAKSLTASHVGDFDKKGSVRGAVEQALVCIGTPEHVVGRLPQVYPLIPRLVF
uniref:Uncharacterized protein n=1 Tax=Physcomitrium patens TaxID=3218 RepID=A0A2K1J2A8_PHYPA|nr:hypothetical protein PHYPA_021512 [Physcomitrium patens]